MNLNYGIPVQEEPQDTITTEESIVEDTPTVSQKSLYFSPKQSDKLQSFVSMQRTVNAALQRDIDNSKAANSMQPVQDTGGSWENTKNDQRQ